MTSEFSGQTMVKIVQWKYPISCQPLLAAFTIGKFEVSGTSEK